MADEFVTDRKRSNYKQVGEQLPFHLLQNDSNLSCVPLSTCNVALDGQNQGVVFLPNSMDVNSLGLFSADSIQNQPLATPPMTSSVVPLTSPVDSGVALVDSDFDNTSVSEVTLDNDKNEDDDLPFTSLDESGVVWGERIESEFNLTCNRNIVTQIKSDKTSIEALTALKNSSTVLPVAVPKNVDDNIHFQNKEVTAFDDKNFSSSNRFENKNVIVSDSNAISYSSDGDEIVYRRTRGRKAKKEKTKCVSFHEDSNKADVKHYLVNGDSKRFSVDDNLNFCMEKGIMLCSLEDQVRRENFNNSDKESTLLLLQDFSASDGEVGVEFECRSNSRTVTEISLHKKQVYKRRNNMMKNENLEFIQSNVNRSDLEVSCGSMSSLNSSRNYESNEVKRNFCKSQLMNFSQKRHSLGHLLKSIKGQWLIPVSERGVPEGQEDPPKKFNSTTLLNEKCLYNAAYSSIDVSSESEWSSDFDDVVKRRKTSIFPSGYTKSARRNLWPSRNLHMAVSKTSLVNRFLQSIPESKINFNLALNRTTLPLYIKGAKPDEELSNQILKELENEIKNYRDYLQPCYSEEIYESLHKVVSSCIFLKPQENIYKIYKVSSLEGLPLLCVLSDISLYVIGISPVNQRLFNHHVILYSQLDSVIVGPNSQVMILAVTDKNSRVTVLTTFGQNMVNELLSHLELAVRRLLGSSNIAIQEISLENMTALKKLVIKESSVQKDENLEHYVWVKISDSSFIPASNPLGPTKSGHLMFRPHRNSSWLPGYMLLKAGVLYVFADVNQRLPNHAVPLHSGQCGGCRRVPHPTRPHTFEIILPTPGATFQLAAADEYEVSDWLQAFVQAASGDSDSEVIHDKLCEAITSCALLLTTNHILTLSFPHKVLACAQLQYISSIKLAFNCCVLETGCREVSEGGGDWVIYFASDSALEEFLSNLVRLHPSLIESIFMMSESDPLNIRCEQTSSLLLESWRLLLNPLSCEEK